MTLTPEQHDAAITAIKTAVRATILLWDALHDIEAAVGTDQIEETLGDGLDSLIADWTAGYDASEDFRTEDAERVLAHLLDTDDATARTVELR